MKASEHRYRDDLSSLSASDAVMMFKVLVLQTLYNLADE